MKTILTSTAVLVAVLTLGTSSPSEASVTAPVVTKSSDGAYVQQAGWYGYYGRWHPGPGPGFYRYNHPWGGWGWRHRWW